MKAAIDAARRPGLILTLGYNTAFLSSWLAARGRTNVINMDGLEWKREKYSGPVRRFLRHAEALAVKYSHHYIADSEVIQAYLSDKYGIRSRYIPYGADPSARQQPVTTDAERSHYLLMARMEPENNIQTILEGFHASASKRLFRVVAGRLNDTRTRLVSRTG